MSERYDSVVIGAGIIGLAHAWHLAKAGERVLVVERSPRAEGASVRNFGMIWPIGQADGPHRDLALRSRDLWLDLVQSAGLWHDRAGSLHVALHDDEARVLEEYRDAHHGEGTVRLLTAEEAGELVPRLRTGRLRAALASHSEVLVDPREVVRALPDWLGRTLDVTFRFGCAATEVSGGQVRTAQGSVTTGRTFICSGTDLVTLFPEVLATEHLVLTQLQMMRTTPLPERERLGPAVAAGLTLAHYRAFESCPGHPALVAGLEERHPEERRHGIHVMAAQNGLGEVVIGDSHHYGSEIEPFACAEVDRLILAYLDSFLDLTGIPIASRWTGRYVKNQENVATVHHPAPGVTAVTGVGGAGMTLSMGLAEAVLAGRFAASA